MKFAFRLLVWAVVVAGLVGGALYLFVFDVWVVPSDDPLFASSLAPTLAPGDVVLLLRRGSVGRGNLVRCPDPQAGGRYVVARAYGSWGDQLVIDGESVTVDGKRSASPRACDQPHTAVYNPSIDDDVELVCSVEDYGGVEFEALRSQVAPEPRTAVTVEAGSLFLVSDDRHIHLDSRDFGPVGASACAHVVFRVVGAAGIGDERTRLSIVW